MLPKSRLRNGLLFHHTFPSVAFADDTRFHALDCSAVSIESRTRDFLWLITRA